MLYSGVTGKVELSNTTPKQVAHISEFSVEISAEIIEALSLGSEWKDKIAGIKDWTASSDGSCDFDEESSQEEIINALISGAVLPFSFYLDSTTKLSGNALIENCSISNAADGKADISISITGCGPIALTTV